MAWGIDQVDKVRLLLATEVFDVGLIIEGDSSGLDGDTSFLFVFSSVGESCITSVSLGNNSGSRNQGVSECRLSVVDVGNN